MKILFVGGTGNLGSLIVQDLLKNTNHSLRLLIHSTRPKVPDEYRERIEFVEGDMDKPESLQTICEGIDVVIMMAGILFVPFPSKRLWQANFEWSKKLIDLAVKHGVKRFILTSYPQVAGDTYPESPADGALTSNTKLDHAISRLEAEKYLMDASSRSSLEGVIVRSGMVYGPNARLLNIIKKLMRSHCLFIWRKVTWMHLISLDDFLSTYRIVIEKPGLSGVYQACDERPIVLRDLLFLLSEHWKLPKPKIAPRALFWTAGMLFELASYIPGVPCFVNRELVNMGMLSACADTKRFRKEVLPKLKYPTFEDGISTLI